YKCIEKASYLAMEQSKADRAAASTPEAIARRKAEGDARDARLAEERERRRALEAARPVPTYTLRLVDANTASEAELAAVCSVDAAGAAQIVGERVANGRFADWADLVHRVRAVS